MGKKAAIRFVPRLWHIKAEGQADCFTQAPARSVFTNNAWALTYIYINIYEEIYPSLPYFAECFLYR